MLMQILTNTPKWVFVLFLVLLWQGLNQMLPRTVGLTRSTIVPLAMTALSLYGVVSVFGDTPQSLLTWVVGAALAFAVYTSVSRADQIRYDAASRTFNLPGSVVPLILFMGIFLTKYAVGVSTRLQPALVHDSSFALSLGMLYGAFSGVFLARATQLWRLALAQPQADAHKTLLA